jgi:hypothetical protein
MFVNRRTRGKKKRRKTNLFRLGPLLLGEGLVEDAAMGGTLETEAAVVGLARAETGESLDKERGETSSRELGMRKETGTFWTSSRSSTTECRQRYE